MVAALIFAFVTFRLRALDHAVLPCTTSFGYNLFRWTPELWSKLVDDVSGFVARRTLLLSH
jgi:hypothetical protein